MKKVFIVATFFLIIVMGVVTTTSAQKLKMNPYKKAASLYSTPNPIIFEETYIGEVSSVNITFENTGGETMDVSDITFTNPSFSIDYTSFTMEPGISEDIPVYFTSPTTGIYEETMLVWSNDPNSPFEVELTGNAIALEGWNYVNETGTSFILFGMSFPEGQSEIGYACGMEYTYNADGVIVKTTDGGMNWEQIWPVSGEIDGLEAIWFTDENTGFAAGWNDYFIKTTDGGDSWTEVTVGTNVWYYTDIQFWDADNGVASARLSDTGAGIFVTEDGGDTWTDAVGANMNIHRVDYATEDILYAIDIYTQLIKSVDGGNNWTPLTAPPSLLMGIDFVTEDFGVIGAEERMYATTDGGNTWIEHVTGYENFYATKAYEDGTAYIGGTDERIWLTTDFGQTWTNVNSGTTSAAALYRIREVENGTLFACGSQGTILINTDNTISGPVLEITPNPVEFEETLIGEESTKQVSFANVGTETLEISDITFTNSDFTIENTSFNIEAGESGELSVSFEPTAPGLHEGLMQVWSNDPNSPFEVELTGNAIAPEGWNYVNESGTSFILYGMSFPEGQSEIGYACGMEYTYNADGVIVKTTDGGINWEQIWPVSGEIDGLQSIWFTDENTGFAAGWNNYLIKTTDGGQTWTNVTCGSNVWYYTDIQFWDENKGVVSAIQYGSDPGVYVTEDGGDTWTPATSGINSNIWAVDYAGEHTVFAINISGYLYKSTDDGYNWTQMSSPGAMLMGIDFVTEDFGVIGAEERMYATTNGGDTWIENFTGYENFYATKAFENGTAYIGGTDERIYVTNDFGATWTMENSGTTSAGTLYRIREVENGTLFACGSQGRILYKVPTLTSSFTADETEICAENDVSFTDQSTGNPTSWSWTFEGGTPETSTEQNPLVIYETSGVYDVELEISNGTETSIFVIEDYITVDPLPGLAGTPEGLQEVCVSGIDTYTTTGSEFADAMIWTIDPVEAGTIEGSGNEITIDWSNSYNGLVSLSCEGMNDCGNGPVSEILEITVNELPTPEISGSNLVCNGEETDYLTTDYEGSTYIWTVEGGEITSGAGTHMITVLWGDPGMGYVNVIETSEFGCEQSTENSEVTIDECTGINELGSNPKITYSISDNLVNINSSLKIIDLTVFDITGKTIISKSNLNMNCVKLNLSGQNYGLYIILVNGKTFTESIKIIK